MSDAAIFVAGRETNERSNMKILSVLSTVALLVLAAGCATQKPVATLRGHGTRQVYTATFDQMWRAAVDAAQRDDLEMVTADRDHGYIGARRTTQSRPFGEDIGIWVRQVGPASSEVEVVSREPGSPVLWPHSENDIQRSIAANLAREVPAIGAAPREVIIERGTGSSTIIVPERRETIIVPETAPTHEALRDEQRRIDALRLKQQTGERALANEVDETKREMLQREVDRLREDIKLQEKRLRDIERELK
jgi:hypothetical protein